MIKASFVADFTSFKDAVDKAQAQLVDFGKGAGSVEKSLNKMSDSLSGRKLIQDAVVMEKAVQEIGGTSKLTGKELERVSAQAVEATEKMKKMGIDVPPGLQKIADTAKGPLTSAFEKVGSVALAAFSGAAILTAGKKVIDYASTVTDLSQKLGVSTGAVQKWQLAFEANGIAIDVVGAASTKLSKALISGDASAVGALQKLGLSISDLKKQSPEDQFTKVADAVGSIANPTEKAFAAMTIFGKGGAELLAGLDGHLAETMAHFEEMGLIIDEKTIKAADDFGDQLGALGKQLLGVVATIIGPLIPALSGLANILSKIGTVVGPLVGAVVKGVTIAFTGLYEGIALTLAKLADLAQKIPFVGKYLGGLADASTWLKNSAADADKFIVKMALGIDDTGTKATKATAPLLGLGDTTKDTGEKAKKAAADFEKLLGHLREIEGTKATFTTLGLVDALKSLGTAGAAPVLKDIAASSVRSATDLDGLRDSTEGLQRKGQFLTAAMIDVNKQIGILPAGAAGLGKSFDDAGVKAKSFGDTLKGSLSKSLSGLNDVFQRAFEGGGGVKGALKSFATDALEGVLDAIPVIGPTIGKFAGAITAAFGKLFGGSPEKQVNPIREAFVQAAGGLETLNEKAHAAGITLDALLNAKNMDAYKKAVDDINAAFQTQAEKIAAAKDELDILTKSTEPDFKHMEDLANKYGIKLSALGPAFQSAKLHDLSGIVVNDFDELVRGGADVDAVLTGMKKPINDLVNQSIAAGVALPAQFKPWVDQLALTGQLTDVNGDKLTDLSNLKFGDPVKTEFQKILDKIEELITKIGTGLTGAIRNIPAPSPVHVPVVWDIPDLPRQESTAFSGGGIVPQYAALGKVINFRPRGTDTVPAMLTPGERVLSLKETAAYNAGASTSGGGNSTTVDVAALQSEVAGLRQDLRRLIPKIVRDAVMIAPRVA